MPCRALFLCLFAFLVSYLFDQFWYAESYQLKVAMNGHKQFNPPWWNWKIFILSKRGSPKRVAKCTESVWPIFSALYKLLMCVSINMTMSFHVISHQGRDLFWNTNKATRASFIKMRKNADRQSTKINMFLCKTAENLGRVSNAVALAPSQSKVSMEPRNH